MSIINFEKITEDLTAQEIETAKFIAGKIQLNIGRKMARTNKTIATYMKENYGIALNSIRIRKIIAYIRAKGWVPDLIATSKGYWRAENEEELRKYIHSRKQRVNEISRVTKVMEDYCNHKYNIQNETTTNI